MGLDASSPPREKKGGFSDNWRRYGEQRRQQIVENDEVNTSFHLNRKCPIDRYFELAERVVNQFREQCGGLSSSNLEDTYVMGHRLIAFLSLALPQHPEYLHVSVSARRNKTFRDLVWINEKMEDLALKIDEHQLNRYISLEYDPNPGEPEDEEDDEQSTHSSGRRKPNWSLSELEQGSSWESFPDWNLFGTSELSSDLPNVTDTDTSSFDNELNNTRETCSDSEREESTAFVAFPTAIHTSPTKERKKKKQVKFQLDSEAEVAVDSNPKESLAFSMELESARAIESTSATCFSAKVEVFEDYSGEPEVLDEYETRYMMHDALQVSEFLRKIAEEDVRYEIDSDANDSWAQDAGEEAVSESGDGSGSALTCDPARLAFPQLTNKMATTASSPKRTEYMARQDESGDHWASFNFASVRQKLV